LVRAQLKSVTSRSWSVFVRVIHDEDRAGHGMNQALGGYGSAIEASGNFLAS
jgi:hypothetical protein